MSYENQNQNTSNTNDEKESPQVEAEEQQLGGEYQCPPMKSASETPCPRSMREDHATK